MACEKGTVGCKYGGPDGDHVCETLDALNARRDAKERAEEERRAWDRYAAAAMPKISLEFHALPVDNYGPSDAARVADALLEERRKRFGAGK